MADKTNQNAKKKSPQGKKNTPANDNKRSSVKNTFSAKAKKPDKTKPVKGGKVHGVVTRDRINLSGTKFIFTSAQNNTDVWPAFFNSLIACANDKKAQLKVSRFTYNKSGFQNMTKDGVEELWYDNLIKPYILDVSATIIPGLIFAGELDILPTKKFPLAGYDSGYFGLSSAIVPASTIEMVSMPGTKREGARFLYSTGTCTKSNYIQRNAGQQAEGRHEYAATLVEIDEDGDWFVRQLVADRNGAFYDMTNKYNPSGEIERGQLPKYITLGDIHIEKCSPEMLAAVFGPGGMLDQLLPKYLLVHDVTDMEDRSYHNTSDDFFMASQRQNTRRSVEYGVAGLTAKFFSVAKRNGMQIVVPHANHHSHFWKWLMDPNSLKQENATNARFWCKCRMKMYEEIEKGKPDFREGLYEWAVREWAKDNGVTIGDVRFLDPNDDFIVFRNRSNETDLSQHGHLAPGGGKGSPKSYRKSGRQMTTGHTHQAGIKEDVYTVGMFDALDAGYNKGMDAWSNTHCVGYRNGNRTLITVRVRRKSGNVVIKWGADDDQRITIDQKMVNEWAKFFEYKPPKRKRNPGQKLGY